MKTCKFCNAELPEGTTVCPSCGKDNAEQKTLSVGKTVLAVVAVLAVVVLAAGVLLGMGSAGQEPEPTTVPTVETTTAPTEGTTAPTEGTTAPTEGTTVPTEPPTVPEDGNPDDMTCKGTYTADDETVIAARDTVVATAGEYELTLGQLQVYYWMEVRNFMSQYGAYAAFFGLDINQSLDTQTCAVLEQPCTWQQFFLQSALNSWHSYRTMAAEADLNGFQMTDPQKDAIENAAAQLDEAAVANGYESGIAMVHSSLGPAAELEDYVYFMEMYYKANGYYNQLTTQYHPTDEELEAYFQEHAEGYASGGITKDTKSVDVRHILIYPEGADSTNIFTGEFGEEAWAAGEKAAQAILDEFLAGEQTEEAFAALAGKNSQDPGSNQNGGLYTGVTEGKMVAAFNDWCFDPARQVGDTGIVKTEYGYHVMYFSGSTLLWTQYVQKDMTTDYANAAADEITGKNPLTVQYDKILLALADLV